MSPTQPSEQRECQCCKNGQRDRGFLLPYNEMLLRCDNCGAMFLREDFQVPSPDQDKLKEQFNEHLLKYTEKGDYIGIERMTEKMYLAIISFITTEKAKSYAEGIGKINGFLDDVFGCALGNYYPGFTSEQRLEHIKQQTQFMQEEIASLHLPTEESKK